ncbi:hypothetical protein KFK09_026048 [Dendrobium nobile]|uniref:Uncharacterized protein n=1 Tax=Dendrobium nobile TaxID=94219 RepID=A0A8T3A6N6_DENNO|nr:hypothetical protein KFK09_026048 [Dendrobium nobile]
MLPMETSNRVSPLSPPPPIRQFLRPSHHFPISPTCHASPPQVDHPSPPTVLLPSTNPPVSGIPSLQSPCSLKASPFSAPSLPPASSSLSAAAGTHPETLTCSDAVYVYSFFSTTWSRGRLMPGPTRSFFACAASPSNQVFFAGGHDEEKNALKSAMVYDIVKND